MLSFLNILPRRLKDEWLVRQGRYSLPCFRVYVPEKCNMAMVASNMSGHIQKQLTRSLERILEEAHLSGELKLSGRKLKDFPKVGKTGSSKYNLQDTVIAGEFFSAFCSIINFLFFIETDVCTKIDINPKMKCTFYRKILQIFSKRIVFTIL